MTNNLGGGGSQVNKKTMANKEGDNWHGTAYVVRAYSLLAIFSLGIFGSLHITTHPQNSVGYLELVGSAALLLNLAILRLTRRVGLVKNMFLLIVLAFLGLMLVTGGTAGTGVFWTFVFPVTAFFLAGKRAGVVWLASLLVLILVVWALSASGAITIPYDGVTLRQLAISLLVVTVGIYAYQHTREQLTTESRESRAELRAEKIRADVIVQHIAEGIITTDARGKVTFMNDTAQKMLGWQARELTGKSFIEVVPMLDEAGNEIPAEGRPMYHSLSSGESQTMNARYRRKDGASIPVSVTGTPLIINGKTAGVIGTFRDISEEQDVVRAKSEFVTLASHQLRTPLSAVSWTTELLLNGDAGSLSREQREHVTAIYRSNQRMAALVSEMLIVSGLDLHSLPVIPQSIALDQLASALVKEQTVAHAGRHPRIHEVYDPSLQPFKCDPEIMKLILRNLISNAIKYTPKKGEVTVAITPRPAGKLHPHSKGSIEFTISDTGYGIPRSATGKLFSKFFRAENIARRDTDGTGLGLYIVKSLLDYVGGRISFRSEEGKGATFTVLLPIEGMEAYRPQQAEPVPQPRKERAHV
jgi:PAS domain S-box-containing protein